MWVEPVRLPLIFVRAVHVPGLQSHDCRTIQDSVQRVTGTALPPMTSTRPTDAHSAASRPVVCLVQSNCAAFTERFVD